MEFRVLGLLEILEDGRALAIERGRQSALLALLVANAGRPLTTDRLVDELWDDQPPQNAVKSVQIYVSRLRARLGRDRIETTPTGYLLRAAADDVDAARAERLRTEGRRLLDLGHAEKAAAVLVEALALWRGDAYADFRFDGFAQAEIARLDELRATASADLADARLALGWADELIPELEAIVRERPLWERPRGQLMLALYRAGRQAEALELYSSTRALLDAELGLEPGPELHALERAILNQSPDVQRPARRGGGGPRADLSQSPRGAFVGRERELRELLEALSDTVAGHGRLVLVGGEPGIGKSRLMDEVARQARAEGVRVVVGRCWEGGGAPAFWPWVQAFRALMRDSDADGLRAQLGSGAAELTLLLPELRELLPDLPEPRAPDSDAARFVLFDATSQFLAAACEARPTVIVLDDLHAADEPSLLMLRFLARGLESMNALVIAAYRDVDPSLSHPLATLQAELAGERGTTRVRLAGLDAREVEEYVELTAAAIASPELVRRLHDDTEGNPLFVAETVRLLSIEGVTRAGLRIPDSVRDVIARRLRHLRPECVRVLELASILGREFGIASLAAAAELSRGDLLTVLDEAVDARVVGDLPGSRGRLRFAHVLIRDTVYDGLSLATRARLHTRVFETLEPLYARDPGGEHLHELAALGLAAEAYEQSFGYARRAAERAVGLRSYDEAARLFRLALEALSLCAAGDDRTRCELLLELGDAETRSGDSAAAKATFVAAAELARTLGLKLELARAAAGYGGWVAWGRAGHDRRLVPLLEEALAELGDSDDALRVRLLSRLAGALRDEPSRERRDRLSKEAVEIARRLDNPVLLGHALAGRGHAITAPDTLAEYLALGDELKEVGSQSGDRERLLAGHALRMMAQLIEKGDLRGAEAELAESTAVAEELQQAVPLWECISTKALVALATGRFTEAESLSEQAAAIGQRALPDAAVAIHEMQRAALLEFRGRLEEAAPAVRTLADSWPSRPVFRCALTYVEARLGHLEAAAAVLEELSRDRFAVVPFDQEWLYAMSFAAEAATLTGARDAAADLYDLLLPWSDLTAADVGEGFRGSVSRYVGLVAAATDRHEEADRSYEHALAANERMGARPWLALTQHDYGTLLLARPGADHVRGRELVERAAASFRELGMVAGV